MPREFTRNVRIAEAIRRIAAPLLTAIARDQALGMISITNVEVTGDLTTAKLFVSVLGNPSEADVISQLRAYLPKIRSALAREIRLKKFPVLHLAQDSSIALGAHIAELLKPPAIRDS